MDTTEIQGLIAQGRLEEALMALNQAMQCEQDSEVLHLMRGKVFWKLGNKGAAISDYESAVAINPDSPAAHLLEHARGIMDFFNPDQFNP
ncbi:MAG: hypothetical protein LIP09_16265 [Bacteroidales bacterium]|nr:hypothetical protein [Bacteroidales bacterium]